MIISSGNLQTLFVGYQAAFESGFGQAPTTHEALVTRATSSTDEEEYGWLGDAEDLREWVGERVLTGLKQHAYSIRNRKFERTISVKADHIRDDRYGIYGMRFRALGDAAARHPCQLVYDALQKGFSELCYDGQNFFDTDHAGPNGIGTVSNTSSEAGGTPWFLLDLSRPIKPLILQTRESYSMQRMDAMHDEHAFMLDEYRYGVRGRCNVGYALWQIAYGSRATLDVDHYVEARTALLQMQGDTGAEMGVMPTHLVIPPSLESKARELIKAERQSNGATNVWMDSAEIIISPWLPR